MKKLHKALAMLLLLVFCMTAIPVSAAADATLTVAKVEAKAGDTVEVPVTVTHLEDVASIGFHVRYDPAALKCVSAKMCDAIAAMDMANANIKPVRHQNTVILTAISLKPVVLDGTVLTVTFEVLETASDGLAVVEITSEGLSVSKTDLSELTVDTVSGGVMIGDVAAETPSTTPDTSATMVTTTAKEKPATQATTATTVKNDRETTTQTPSQSVTQPNSEPTKTQVPSQTDSEPSKTDTPSQTDSEPVQTEEQAAVTTTTMELPEETVVDIGGNIVTDAKGEPTKVKTIGVFVDSATAKPNETVTIKVSLSEAANLTALGLSLHFDTTALTFEGGECIGFVKDSASMCSVLENKSGVVDISAMGAKGMSGSGEIAEIRFKVKSTAKNGEYRLAIKGDPLLQTSEFEYPVKTATGILRVEGAVQQNPTGLYAAIGIVVAAAAVALIVWFCLRRKKNTVVKETENNPAVINVSGEEDE